MPSIYILLLIFVAIISMIIADDDTVATSRVFLYKVRRLYVLADVLCFTSCFTI